MALYTWIVKLQKKNQGGARVQNSVKPRFRFGWVLRDSLGVHGLAVHPKFFRQIVSRGTIVS
jgi:hypothetical protein